MRRLKWHVLCRLVHGPMYTNFLSLPKFLLCVLAMKLLVFKVGCKPPHASRASEAREVDASEWMRLQYSDAVREDFLVRGEYIDFEQPWINLVHSAAMSGRHPDFESDCLSCNVTRTFLYRSFRCLFVDKVYSYLKRIKFIQIEIWIYL